MTIAGNTATSMTYNLTNFGKAGSIKNVTAAAGPTTMTVNMTDSYADLKTVAPTAINVTATGTNSLTLTAAGATVEKTVVDGNGSVTFVTAFTQAANPNTFTAAKNSGGVTAEFNANAVNEITGGSGNDKVTITETAANSKVSLGAGDDTLILAATKLANLTTADGGEGDSDIINILNGAELTAAAAKVIDNFEVLDVSGGKGEYKLNLENFSTVQIDESVSGQLADAVILSGAGAGFTLNVMSKKGTNADFDLNKAQTISLADASGTSDTVTINAVINDGNNDGTADGNIIMKTSTTIADVENINIVANVGTADADVAASAYTLTFDSLVTAAAQTVTVGGDASVVLGAIPAADVALSKIDASASTGNVTADATAAAVGVQYIGCSGVDTYTSSAKGDTIYAGAGADVLTVAVSTTSNATTVLYKAASDSQLKDTTGDGKITIGDGGADNITGFTTAGNNTIDLTSFGFTSGQRGIVDVTAKLSNTTDLTSVADLFDAAGVDRGLATWSDGGGNTWLFVDANKDGNFTAADDMAVLLTGTATVNIADFAL